MQNKRLRALARLTWPVLLLCACPQLLDDDFGIRSAELPPETPTDGGVPSAGGAPSGGAGAGSGGSAGRAPEDGGAGGSGGTTAPNQGLPDAGGVPLPDAGGGNPDPIGVLLASSLVHRYRFSPDATLEDSVGTADASSVGVTFSDGAAVFAGTGQYLDLPNDLLSGLTNATIEVWVVWTVPNPLASTAEWQRIFDFGSNSSTIEGQQGSNANAFFVTPKAGTNGKLHVEYESSGNINLEAPEPLPTQVLVQVVVVVDEENQLLSMYQDGALQGARAFTGSLTTITYRNNWLGRSQYADNPSFQGRLLDVRVYAAALASPHVQASFAAGADADW